MKAYPQQLKNQWSEYIIYNCIVYCDVVNVQPRFNFSDEIIK